MNTLADEISKHHDTDDWSIDRETFAYIQTRFGTLEIDRFASSSNKMVPRFDARFHCPEAETINTFTADWGTDFNWLCPPVSLVGNALKHAKICRAKCILFVPEWKSSYFWPLLTPDGETFYPFVKEFELLDPYYFKDPKLRTVFKGLARFRGLALLIQF